MVRLTFLLVLLGLLLSGSLFSLGFISLVRKKVALGMILCIVSMAVLISMFVFIKDLPPVYTMD
jgi:hypothetical protein